MKYLHIDNLNEPLNQLPKLYVHEGFQYPIRELWNKGYTADVEALGWQGVEPTVPDYDATTHKLGDVTYTLTDGVLTGEYATVALSESELAAIAKEQARQDKLTGVEFQGVMCSATKEDMWGLNSVKEYVASGMSVPFEFDNGNTLVITPENMADFEAVWVPFRASFFG